MLACNSKVMNELEKVNREMTRPQLTILLHSVLKDLVSTDRNSFDDIQKRIHELEKTGCIVECNGKFKIIKVSRHV